ncbi:MAG TPA: apolipoprotein N-acyltransferase [bacterium]|nr:apolipoprotein N-acyltransferase [bacterium]
MAAVLSGILTAFSLPAVLVTPWGSPRLPDLGWAAWLALVPLYFSLSRQDPRLSPGAAFRKGFLYGFVHFGLTLYWIVIALHRYGEVSLAVSFLTLGAGVALMAFFPAGAAWGAVRLRERGAPFGASWLLLTVALEFLRNFVPFGGFPWSSLAYSQRSFTTLLQILDVTGIQGILMLILLANVGIAEICRRHRERANTRFAPALVFAGLLAASLVYGHFRLEEVRRDVAARPVMTVGIVQGNIPQEEKWLSEKIEAIIARHVALTEKLLQSSPELIFWPEAAFPAVLPPEVTRIQELEGVTAPLLMGVVRYDGVIPEDWPPKETDSFKLYNSAVLLKPEGEIDDRYDKVHLVPMGEYVPYQKLLPFLHGVAEDMSSFTVGRGFHLMDVEGRKFGVTICYEDLFPEISRTFTRAGADFLVNLTNDGWYERSSAVFQHFDFSRYRAVENRRAMVRVTNTGVTAVFDPTGEIRQGAVLPPFEEGTLLATVPLGGVASLYARWGDWFSWGCVAALVLLIPKTFSRRSHVQGN